MLVPLFYTIWTSSQVVSEERKDSVKSNEAYRELSFELLKTWPCKDGLGTRRNAQICVVC